MKKIALTTKEDLNIFMSPVRQQLLRQLNIAGNPLTPKVLADKLQISASSVQHHIKKLIKVGLIELDHTETINGIKASFYRPAEVKVQVGLERDDEFSQQREVLVQDSLARVYDGFREQMKKNLDAPEGRDLEKLRKMGDILTGIVHLSEQESGELFRVIDAFIEQHTAPKAGSNPWEYALIAYRAGDRGDE